MELAPLPFPPPPDDLLGRALAWHTAHLPPAAAARAYAQTYAEVACSPDLAAAYAYALGYWEGQEATRASLGQAVRALAQDLAAPDAADAEQR